jgi:chromosome partitioning protein
MGECQMAKKISLLNMKGGVGKSTLAVNLAHHYAGYTNWKKKVLVVDLDPQFNASQYLLGYNKMENIIKKDLPTVYHVFEMNTPSMKGIDLKKSITNATTYNAGGKVDVVPSRLELAYCLKNPGDKARNLKTFIDSIEADYDIIIFDCAPTDSMITEAAYLASDYILVPVRPEYLSSIGIPLLIQSISEFHEKYPTEKVEITGIVFNATENYSPEEAKSKEQVRKITKTHNIHIFESEVSYSRTYSKGARESKPIFHTSYARLAKIREFLRFSTELSKKVGI